MNGNRSQFFGRDYQGCRFGDLSPARRRLLLLIQQVYFGRIANIRIRKSEPLFEPAPIPAQDWKFSSENAPRPGLNSSDVVLKAQHRDLLMLLDRIGDGEIAVLQVQHGMPFKAELPPGSIVTQ